MLRKASSFMFADYDRISYSGHACVHMHVDKRTDMSRTT